MHFLKGAHFVTDLQAYVLSCQVLTSSFLPYEMTPEFDCSESHIPHNKHMQLVLPVPPTPLSAHPYKGCCSLHHKRRHCKKKKKMSERIRGEAKYE